MSRVTGKEKEIKLNEGLWCYHAGGSDWKV